MKHAPRLLARIMLITLSVGISSAAYAQSDLMKAVAERLAASFKKLEAACADDVKKYCSTVTPGEGRLLLCMQAHEDKIGDGCASALDEATLQAETIADRLREAVNACRADIDKFCEKIRPGQGRIAACLAANRTSVSKTCLEAVQKVQDQ